MNAVRGGRRLRIELLGQVRAWRGEEELTLGPPRRRVVLTVLALRANQVVSREEIVDAVWGDAPPATAINGMYIHIGALRRVLEPEPDGSQPVLVSSGTGYLLRLAPDQLDLAVFGNHLERARRLRADGALGPAVEELDAALPLWQGTPLAGVSSPVVEAQRLRLTEQRLTAVEDRAEALLELGQHAALVAELSALAEEHPLRERPRTLLMLAMYRAGRQADALAVYRDTHRMLVEELGIEPGPQLRRVHREIASNRDAKLVKPADMRQGPRDADPFVPRQLPPAVRHFAGRSTELQSLTGVLDEAVATGNTVVISAIDGTAGIGKTALAVLWAHRVAARFPDGQLYVNLRGFDPADAPMAPADALRGFLEALQVPRDRIPAGFDAQVDLYRSLLAGRRVLIVLDNARDVEQVRPLLPGTVGCLALVTSRNRLTGLVTGDVTGDGAYAITLGLLTAAEARELLTRHLGAARVAAEAAAADQLIDDCARLPLALSIVAARAATRPRFTLGTLTQELRESRGGLDPFDGGDPTSNARAVFSWSYQTLSRDAARLFRLLGLCPGPDITGPAAASLAALPQPDAARLLAELARSRLIDEHAPGRFTFHDLLRAYAAEQAHTLDSDTDRREAVLRVLDHYLHTAFTCNRLLYPQRDPITLVPARPGVTPEAPADQDDAMAWFTAEHPVLLAAIRHAADAGLDAYAWQLAWTNSTFLNMQGHWHDWVATQSTALTAARRLGNESWQANAHRSLGLAYIRLDRDGDADAHFQQALQLYAALGDDTGAAHAHLSLGRMFEGQGRFTDALSHARQALDLFRSGGYPAGVAGALNNVGWYYAQLGNYQQTLTYCEQALASWAALGDRYGQANAWDSLGYAHHHLGYHAEAAEYYQKALVPYRDLGDRYYEAGTLTRLGEAYQAAGEVDSARDAWQRALTILEQVNHPDADKVRTKLHDAGDATG